jgi:hypothetical protein
MEWVPVERPENTKRKREESDSEDEGDYSSPDIVGDTLSDDDLLTASFPLGQPSLGTISASWFLRSRRMKTCMCPDRCREIRVGITPVVYRHSKPYIKRGLAKVDGVSFSVGLLASFEES